MGFVRPKPKKNSTTSTPTVTRVEIEHSDGTISRLTGDDANKWNEACQNAITMAFVHGVSFPPFGWETFKRA